MDENSGRGGACPRGANAGVGRPRGSCRGRNARPSLDFIEPGPSTSPLPTSSHPPQPTEYLSEQLEKARVVKVADKNLNRLMVEQKATVAAMREKKQLVRYLLPDAPPPKRQKRKSSPSRLPCPLLSGVLATPPPRKLQAWDKQSQPEPERERQETSGPWRHVDVSDSPSSVKVSVAVPEPEHGVSVSNPPSSIGVTDNSGPYMFVPSTGILRAHLLHADFIHPDAQFVEGEIESVGFTPTSSSGPSRVERSTPSPEWLEPNIFDDNEFLENAAVNPGSDVEEPDEEPGDVGIRQQGSQIRTEEDVPSDLVLLLDEMDTRDDSALREAASSNPEMLHFDWSNDPAKFVGQQEVFSGESGPTFSIDGLTPLDVFQKIWDTETLELIVRESNRYGRQLYAASNKPWSDIDGDDVWIFLALLMLQSLLVLPVEREYWYPCLAQLKVGNFHDIMPLKKFLRIKKCLHFVDNNFLRTQTAAGEDQKLQKIWPIIEHMNKKFSSLYLPEQYIAIDESLLLRKGRLSFVQLIATKAARVGIKSYELCESRTGYLWKMLLYTGKGDKSTPADDTTAVHDEPEGATSKIVYNLVRPLLNKGHTLVMDNFNNSPLLSRTLKTKKTDTMGTIRLKREFVPETLRNINKSNTRQGEVVFSQTEDLTISVWHDANIVSMISTYHRSDVGGKEKYGTDKYKPQVVLDYNMAMGGIDKKDQMLQAFPVERVRNLVWYKKLFRRLLNISIYNSFVIYNHNKNGSQRKFRVTLAKEILERVQAQKPDPRQQIRRTGHFPTKSDTNRSRCKMCAMKKVQTRTAYKCDTCHVNLCIVGCFREYHLME